MRTATLASVVASLALVACSTPISPSASPLTPVSTEWELTATVDGREHRAVLATAPPSNGNDLVYRLVSIEPPLSRPLHYVPLRWVLARISSQADLLLPSGDQLIHPDRLVLKRLLGQLDELGVEGALARMPGLLRAESRAKLFEAACKLPTAKERFGKLLSAVGPRGALQARTFEGLKVELTSSAKLDALRGLARIPGLDSAAYAAITAFVPSMDYDVYEAQLLCELVESTSVTQSAVLLASQHMGHSSAPREVLQALASRPRLTPAEADLLVEAAPRLRYDTYEQKLLEALIQRGASTKAVLRSAKHIAGSSSRRDVLRALIERGLNEAEARQLARAIPPLEYDVYERKLLVTLLLRSPVTVRDVLTAAGDVGSSSEREDVLEALANRRRLAPEDVERVAAAVPGLAYDAYEQRLLLRLLKRGLPTEAGLTAAAEIQSKSERRIVLLAMANQRQLSTADANAIARAVPKLQHDAYEGELLLALVGKADAAAIRSSLRQVRQQGARVRVLEALLE